MFWNSEQSTLLLFVFFFTLFFRFVHLESQMFLQVHFIHILILLLLYLRKHKLLTNCQLHLSKGSKFIQDTAKLKMMPPLLSLTNYVNSIPIQNIFLPPVHYPGCLVYYRIASIRRKSKVTVCRSKLSFFLVLLRLVYCCYLGISRSRCLGIELYFYIAFIDIS